ncbi:MAG TPA: toxin-antitoxin system YwqK family antitoxin [Bacteroidales bacterium]|nr:toxin-antitoxin system YwqK family antitoxin [Bacteroidales bacterium]
MKKLKTMLVLLFVALAGFGQIVMPDDTIKNQTNEQGLKQGYWEEMVGRAKTIGTYVDSQKHGTWIFYHPNDVIQSVQTYNMGKKEGLFVEIDNRGYYVSETYYKDDALHGPIRSFDRGSRLLLEESYLNGLQQGLRKAYYNTGLVQEESYFDNGLKDGASKWYNQSGKVIAEYNYQKGEFEGVQKTFHDDGALMTEETYSHNLRQGPFREYYQDGALKTEGDYDNNLKHGIWKEYNPDGTIASQAKFRKGVEK